MLGLLVTVITVIFIVNGSGFVEAMKRKLWRWFYGSVPYDPEFSLRPFDCALCATFWAGVIYVSIIGWSWYRLLGVILLSWNADIIHSAICLCRDLVTTLINRIYECLNI